MRLHCLLLPLICLSASCSKRSPEELLRPEASAPPQASAGTAQKSVSPVSKERGSPQAKPQWDFEAFQGPKGRVFSLQHAALICAEPCTFPDPGPQRLWLVKGDTAEPANAYWPRSVWGTYSAAMKQAKLSTRVTFLGDYPAEVRAYGAVESRSGEGNLPLVKFVAGAWQRDHREIPSDKLPLPPREYDAALLSAPVDRNPLYSFAWGAGAPTMVTKNNLLLIHDGKQWTTKPAEWGRYAQLTRLADGSTLALDQDVWLISAKGEITLLDLEGHHAETTVAIGGEAWIMGDNQLSRPRVRGRFKVAQLPRRAAPAGVSTVTAPIEDPSEFDARCKTPLVLLQHSDGRDVYAGELAGLFAEDPGEGAGLQAYQVKFALGDRSAVQAEDKAAADRLLDVLKSHQDLKAELRCSDLSSLLPNPYAGSQYLQRLFIHARSGVVLELT
ncbi:MAG: hypothetical protein AB7S68_31040 [Polyangiaceae bacterium]